MDRADCVAMACYRLMELRNADALDKEQVQSDFSKIFANNKSSGHKKVNNPFAGQINPFIGGKNPFN